MNYTLDLIINPKDLDSISKADLKIVVAKPVVTTTPNVSWLVFEPFEGNKIEWDEEYGIYASTLDKLKNGAKIKLMSEVAPPAVDGKVYTFGTDSATFKGPTNDPNVNKGTFKITNEMSAEKHPHLTFGLTQKATIRDGIIDPSPLNAAIVMSQMDVMFTPITTVWVWLQNQCTSGSVITDITSKSTSVAYVGGSSYQSLIFDSSQGRFIPVAKFDASLDKNKITFIDPKGIY